MIIIEAKNNGWIFHDPFANYQIILAATVGVHRWRFESHVGLFWGLHSTLAKYEVGNSRTRYNSWTADIGSSVGYSWMLAKRWNLTLEGGVGIFYMNDLRWHPAPSPNEAIRHEHCRRVALAPSKIEVAFSYLF